MVRTSTTPTARVVLLHGVNVVYKHAPYIAYPDPGKPWNFDATDAAQDASVSGSTSCASASNGRRSSRDRAGPNQPAGLHAVAHPGNAARVGTGPSPMRYLSHVAATVKLLGALRDLHPARHAPGRLQHRTSAARERRTGPCAPTTCRSCPKGGRWSNNYSNPDAPDGGGALLEQRRGGQPPGQLRPGLEDRGAVLQELTRGSSDTTPTTSPSRPRRQTASESTFTGQLECFYTGKRPRRRSWPTAPTLLHVPRRTSPTDGRDPDDRSPSISHHLIFVEPDIYWVTGGNIPSQLGPLPFRAHRLQLPRLLRRPQPRHRATRPISSSACMSEDTAAAEQDITRLSMSSAVPVERTRHLHERVQHDDQCRTRWFRHRMGRAGRSSDGPTGPGSTTTSPRVLGRRPGSARRNVLTDRDGALAHVPPGGGRGTPSSIIFNPFTGAFDVVYTPTLAARGVDHHRRSRHRSTIPTGGVPRSREAASPRSPVRRTSPCRPSGIQPRCTSA